MHGREAGACQNRRPAWRTRERRQAAASFSEPDEEMRRQVVALALAAASEHRSVYILVNNKAEGCSPMTIRALAEILAGES